MYAQGWEGKEVCLCIFNYRAAQPVNLSYILIDCDCEHVFRIIDMYLCSDCLKYLPIYKPWRYVDIQVSFGRISYTYLVDGAKKPALPH